MPTSRLPLSDCLEAAVSAAQAAAAILQAHAQDRARLVISEKLRNDLVSQADYEAEAAALEILRAATPGLGILAEESGQRSEGPATWIIDPLDGTTNFLHGIPHYAVSIGLVAHPGARIGDTVITEDTPVVGAVYDPSRMEMFTAVQGGGAWLNGQRIQCSETPVLAEALLATGLPFRDFSFFERYMPMLEHAMRHSRGVRRMGAAALDLAWVACGRFDGYWEMGLAPWDVAAGTILVREAGGVCADMDGREPWPVTGNLYAGNGQLADAMRALTTARAAASAI